VAATGTEFDASVTGTSKSKDFESATITVAMVATGVESAPQTQVAYSPPPAGGSWPISSRIKRDDRVHALGDASMTSEGGSDRVHAWENRSGTSDGGSDSAKGVRVGGIGVE
jgi:hypothetical protein